MYKSHPRTFKMKTGAKNVTYTRVHTVRRAELKHGKVVRIYIKHSNVCLGILATHVAYLRLAMIICKDWTIRIIRMTGKKFSCDLHPLYNFTQHTSLFQSTMQKSALFAFNTACSNICLKENFTEASHTGQDCFSHICLVLF